MRRWPDFRSREDPRGLAGALICLGQAYAGLGQPDRARPALDEARAPVERWGFALHLSGESDASSQEPALGAGIETLADERSGALPIGVESTETATFGFRRTCGDQLALFT